MFKNRIVLLIVLCLFFIGVAIATTFYSPEIVESPTESVIATVQEDIIGMEYQVAAVGAETAVYQAPNRLNGIRTTFSEDGVQISPRLTDGNGWSLGMHVSHIGDDTQMLAVDEAVLSTNGRQITLERGDVVEWYVNSERGLEQGFTFENAPFGVSDTLLVDIALNGSLTGFADGEGQIEFIADSGEAVLTYSKLFAFDANSRSLPTTMSLQTEGNVQTIRLAVETADATYPIVIDPLTSAPDSVSQGVDVDLFGFSVSSAGDVNGDGIDDILIGANWFDGGAENSGAAFVFLGGTNGLNTAVHWQSTGPAIANAEYGFSVSDAGDINNDGFGDVIIGAPGAARTRVYYGSATGLTASNAIGVSAQSGSAFGESVSKAGDVNADGFDDVIVGAPDYVDPTTTEAHGRAYVFYGSASGVSSDNRWIVERRQEDTEFGIFVKGGGDVTGDGVDDVLIADTFGQSLLEEVPKVYIYQGVSGEGLQAGPIASDADANLVLEEPNFEDSSSFGFSVGLADINGDTVQDVIVGAPDAFDETIGNIGRVFVYMGPINGQSFPFPDFQYQGFQDGGLFGYSVSTAGDINGDGFDEFLISTPNFILEEANGDTAARPLPSGAVDILTGSPDASSDFPASFIWFIFSEVENAAFGSSVSTAGDINGDSFDDFLIGAPTLNSGETFFYYGTGAVTGLVASNDGPTELGDPTLLSAAFTSPDSQLNNFSWDLGDGNFAFGKDVSHTYAATGEYLATVTVQNPFGVFTATTAVKVTKSLFIDPETGGSATFDDGQGNSTEVNVPPGAVNEPILIEYTPLTLGGLNRDAGMVTPFGIEQPLPAANTNLFFDLDAAETLKVYLPSILNNASSTSSAFSTQPAVPQTVSGADCPVGHYCFDEPVTIVLNYTDGILNGQDEEDLTVVWWDEATMSWLDSAETCDTSSGYIVDSVNNTITFQICQISRFGMIGAN